MNDVTALEGIQISISPNGSWLWLNVDGICIARIKISDKATIELEDNRPGKELKL